MECDAVEAQSGKRKGREVGEERGESLEDRSGKPTTSSGDKMFEEKRDG